MLLLVVVLLLVVLAQLSKNAKIKGAKIIY